MSIFFTGWKSGKASAKLPKVVGIIPLADAGGADRALQLLLEAHSGGNSGDSSGSHEANDSSTVTHVHDTTHGSSFTYITAPFAARKDVFASLDIARASDIVLFVISAEEVGGGMNDFIDEVAYSL